MIPNQHYDCYIDLSDNEAECELGATPKNNSAEGILELPGQK
jgi:hypothetical protein